MSKFQLGQTVLVTTPNFSKFGIITAVPPKKHHDTYDVLIGKATHRVYSDKLKYITKLERVLK